MWSKFCWFIFSFYNVLGASVSSQILFGGGGAKSSVADKFDTSASVFLKDRCHFLFLLFLCLMLQKYEHIVQHNTKKNQPFENAQKSHVLGQLYKESVNLKTGGGDTKTSDNQEGVKSDTLMASISSWPRWCVFNWKV